MDKRPQCETGILQNPRGEHRQKPLWYQPQQLLSRYVYKDKGNKSENELLGLHQDQKLLHSKGNSQQNKEATHGMGEDICKWQYRQKVDIPWTF